MRPIGTIKLRITLEALERIDSSYKPLLEDSFRKVSAKLGVWVGDFSYVGNIFRFTVQYEINTNITGAINSLKAVSSRSINDYLDIPISDANFVSETKKRKRTGFWAHNYSYMSLASAGSANGKKDY